LVVSRARFAGAIGEEEEVVLLLLRTEANDTVLEFGESFVPPNELDLVKDLRPEIPCGSLSSLPPGRGSKYDLWICWDTAVVPVPLAVDEPKSLLRLLWESNPDDLEEGEK
jgi:hypothetical protein